MKDSDYGWSEKGVIAINIERIWKEARKENKFIDEFTKTYAHELLHTLLEDLELPELAEEETIRAILGETWDSKLELAYSE